MEYLVLSLGSSTNAYIHGKKPTPARDLQCSRVCSGGHGPISVEDPCSWTCKRFSDGNQRWTGLADTYLIKWNITWTMLCPWDVVSHLTSLGLGLYICTLHALS